MPSSRVVAGSDLLFSVSHAISSGDADLAWATLTGRRLFENSNCTRQLGWYALWVPHTSHIGVLEDRRLKDAYDDYPGFQSLEAWKGCLVGAVHVSHSLPCDSCKVKNVFSEVVEFDVLIPITGAGAREGSAPWPLSLSARAQVQAAIKSKFLSSPSPILQTRASEVHPPLPGRKLPPPHDPVPGDSKCAQRVVSVPKPARKRPREWADVQLQLSNEAAERKFASSANDIRAWMTKRVAT